MLIGVDTGGTFTDLVFLHPDGRIAVHKVPSTPRDPSQAILDGLALESLPPGFSLIHGTTVATNALLERRGAKTALITTLGCRDVLEIARQTRAELYSLSPTPRNPLIPRALRYEVSERLDWRGEVITPLDISAVERVMDEIFAQGVESLAVCFLFSFLRSEHEQEVGRHARARGLTVSLSSEIAPEFREYERTSTVCANAYVAPIMARYIARMEERLGVRPQTTDDGPQTVVRRPSSVVCGRLSIMQSNGGALRAKEAAANAIKTVLSGPAGGVIAAVKTAQAAGFDRIMTFDMGGTSTDVALIDGEPVTMRTGEVAGMPLLTPMLDIHTVGAGGGSLARLDTGGSLRVGPQSAGADPGPVAYGRGIQITVTDANILLGRLPADVRLAGSLPLVAERVRNHFDAFAKEMDLTPERAAEGILAVVNAQMARALHHISTERGRDPADYTLVAFGGAGGLHACALAEAIGVRRILIPRYPGAFSALGLALADFRREYVRSFFAPADSLHDSSVRSAMEALIATARRELADEGVPPNEIRLNAFVEAQYAGQSYALRVPFKNRLEAAARAFHRAHRDRYGHADRSQPVEIVTLGVTALARGRELPPTAGLSESPAAPLGSASVWEDGRQTDVPVYIRESLDRGQQIESPVIIIQPDATTFLESGWRAEVDDRANLILEA